MLLMFIAVSIPIHFYTAAQGSEIYYDHPVSAQEQSQYFLHESDCPPWFHFNQATQTCHCFPFFGVKCYDHIATLEFDICATYDEETGQVSLSPCPYFQSQNKR